MSLTPFKKKFNNFSGNTGWAKKTIIFKNRRNNNTNEVCEIPINIGEPKFRTLQILDLSNSRITGKIPREIRNLIELTTLDLSGNLIGGKIPEDIGNLVKLERLFLQDNRLEGEIPPMIENLVNLITVDLSGNLIKGVIPDGIGRLTKLKELFLQNNRLKGRIPLVIGDLDELEKFDINENNIEVIYNEDTKKIIRDFNLYDGIEDLTIRMNAYIETGRLGDLLRNERVRASIGARRISNFLAGLRAYQSRSYPQIAATLESGRNVYYISAHGDISNKQLLIVPKNMSIILTTTPTYFTRTLPNTTLTINVNMDYLEYLLPGISYR